MNRRGGEQRRLAKRQTNELNSDRQASIVESRRQPEIIERCCASRELAEHLPEARSRTDIRLVATRHTNGQSRRE